MSRHERMSILRLAHESVGHWIIGPREQSRFWLAVCGQMIPRGAALAEIDVSQRCRKCCKHIDGLGMFKKCDDQVYRQSCDVEYCYSFVAARDVKGPA